MAETLSKEQIRAMATRAVSAELGNPDAATPLVSGASVSPDNADTAVIDAQDPRASRREEPRKRLSDPKPRCRG